MSSDAQGKAGKLETSSLAGLVGKIAWLIRKFGAHIDRPIPSELTTDPEMFRRARLITRFGILGSIFGIVYTEFYLVIGHLYGAAIIIVCTASVALMPSLMRWKKSVDVAGEVLVLTLTMGFAALCFCEGGLHGHAIAWLVSVPLCALLLVGKKSGQRWALIAFVAGAVIAGVDLAGINLQCTYDPKWNSLVSTAGYLGLIVFMFILGMIFESVRAQALAKMRDALEKLAASNERLVYLNNEKNEFLSIAAHDLKNPLMVVAGNAELITMSKDGNVINKLANSIVGAATRMRNLIKNLLDVDAIEQGNFVSNVERCEINALAQQAIENNQPSAAKKQISICFGPTEGLAVRADRSATLQILDNLLSNALKYSPPNTTVHVHTIPEKDFVLIKIRDEGPGINEADQKRMFQKFSRLSARPTGGESSTGLGLAIVKRLTEAMSGTIQCHSTLGSGATFILRLPVWNNQTPAPVDPPAPESKVRGTSVTIPFSPGRN